MAWWIVFNFTIGSAVAAESQTGEIKLDTRPVFDGMSAAHGKLFVALKDGRVLCLK